MSDILFEELSGRNGNIGLITLNRQKALNALNHQMFLDLDSHLTEWEKAPSIKAVIIRAAEGRAFCAGGDIRYAYEKKIQNDPTLPIFFRDEYQLNLRIFNYEKPYIALLDGITMGGGAGISIHGSHRIGTERLVFAMPETAIGFYPDIGASYFLSRLPYKMGFYLGLTSARIQYNDCFWLGLLTNFVPSENFSKLIHTIADTNLGDNAKSEVSFIIEKFSETCVESELLQHKKEVENCFSKNTIEEIIAALEQGDDWCQQTAVLIKSKSPTSLKITLKALQEGSKLSFTECMRMEFRLTSRFLQGHDFFEGIRAAVIDKDQKPQWKPAELQGVSLHDVNQYFAPLEAELI